MSLQLPNTAVIMAYCNNGTGQCCWSSPRACSARTIKGPPEDTSSAGTCVTNEEGQNNRPNRQRTTSVTFAYSDDAAAARDREREPRRIEDVLRRPYKDPTTDGNIIFPFARIPYSARYANLHWHGTCHPWQSTPLIQLRNTRAQAEPNWRLWSWSGCVSRRVRQQWTPRRVSQFFLLCRVYLICNAL